MITYLNLKLFHNQKLFVIFSTLQEWLQTIPSSTKFLEREGVYNMQWFI